MKCDIEITVTDDEDLKSVGNLTIPPSLRHSSLEADLHRVDSSAETVTLPERYADIIGKANNRLADDTKQDMESREQDLTTALKWIKQEIIAMKEQDKWLMKQFVDLRSTILQLRCVLEMQSSNSDISSMSGSNISLDDTLHSGSSVFNSNLLSVDMESTEFRSRTSSLLTPRKTRVTRIKWKSNEFI